MTWGPVTHNDQSRPGLPRDAERRTIIAFWTTALFAAVEVAGGFLSGSLALVADALHMAADAGALLMAWGAFRLGRMDADRLRSYGYRRWEVLAALANGVSLMALSVWIVVEAAFRLQAPRPVAGTTMLVIAAVGLVANLVVLRVLGHAGEGGHGHHHDGSGGHGHAGHERNLNLEGATLHVLGDLFGSVGAVAAALVILQWGWTPIDPILSVATAVAISFGAIGLSRRAIHILLEGAPEGFDAHALAERLKAAVPGLLDVHHVHAWSLGSGQRALTLHVVVASGADRDAVLGAVKTLLADEMGFPHSVVQVEGEGCDDLGPAAAR